MSRRRRRNKETEPPRRREVGLKLSFPAVATRLSPLSAGNRFLFFFSLREAATQKTNNLETTFPTQFLIEMRLWGVVRERDGEVEGKSTVEQICII